VGGYTLAEEFPIFLFIFAVPTIAAILLKWRVFQVRVDAQVFGRSTSSLGDP
jgi:hypothetical protein